MKRCLMIICLMLLALQIILPHAGAAETEFETFLSRFDYEVRDEMKIDSKRLLQLL